MFDIQRFADGENIDEVVEIETETTEESTPEEQPPIPEELEGLPEDLAREAMEEAAELSKGAPSEEETTTGEDVKKEYVSLSEYNESVNEIKQLKAQIDEIKKGQPIQSQIPQRVVRSQMLLTPEKLKIINAAINNRAMQLTGMSAEEVASLQYADEDDERVKNWNIAREFAKTDIFADIKQTHEDNLKQEQQFLENHAAAVKSYNEFYINEAKEADFEQIKNYAINDYFESIPPAAQPIIAASYARVEHHVASPAEIMLVQNYFAQAKAAYRQKIAEKPQSNFVSKMHQASKLPKADRVNGTTASGDISIADLERMIDNDFSKIPEKYRRIFEG